MSSFKLYISLSTNVARRGDVRETSITVDVRVPYQANVSGLGVEERCI